MKVYCRILTTYYPYPFNDVVNKRYVEFSLSKSKWKTIEGLKTEVSTSLDEKIMYLSEHFKVRVTIEHTTNKIIRPK